MKSSLNTTYAKIFLWLFQKSTIVIKHKAQSDGHRNKERKALIVLMAANVTKLQLRFLFSMPLSFAPRKVRSRDYRESRKFDSLSSRTRSYRGVIVGQTAFVASPLASLSRRSRGLLADWEIRATRPRFITNFNSNDYSRLTRVPRRLRETW